MTFVRLDLESGLAIGALALSVVPLGWTISMALNARRIVSKESNWRKNGLSKSTKTAGFLLDVGALHTGADGLLIRARSLGDAIKAARANRQRFAQKIAAVDSRYAEFLTLLDEWSRNSSLQLRGAAVAHREEIAGLARIHSSLPCDTAAERFSRCTNSVVEYVVEATDAKFKKGAPKFVEDAIERMVKLAGRELICPQSGDAWEPSLHQVVDKVARGVNRPGTIAMVSTRGLRGGRGTMKAKVFLYDD